MTASTYGAGIIDEVKKGLGSTVVGEDKVQTDQTNFDATISKIKAAKPDVIAYGGYTNEAAPLVKQMRAAGVTAKFLGFDGLYDPGFPKGAGDGRRAARSSPARASRPTRPVAPSPPTTRRSTARLRAPTAPRAYDGATILLEGLQGRQEDPRRPARLGERVRQAGCLEVPQVRRQRVTSTSPRSSSGPTRSRATTFEPQQEIKLS